MKRNEHPPVNKLSFWEIVAVTVLRKLAGKVRDAQKKTASDNAVETTFVDVTNLKQLPPHENAI